MLLLITHYEIINETNDYTSSWLRKTAIVVLFKALKNAGNRKPLFNKFILIYNTTIKPEGEGKWHS